VAHAPVGHASGQERLKHCQLALRGRAGADRAAALGERLDVSLPEEKAAQRAGVDPETVLALKSSKQGDEYWARLGKEDLGNDGGGNAREKQYRSASTTSWRSRRHGSMHIVSLQRDAGGRRLGRCSACRRESDWAASSKHRRRCPPLKMFSVTYRPAGRKKGVRGPRRRGTRAQAPPSPESIKDTRY